MPTEDFVLVAQIRGGTGKGVNRRLRRQERIPGIVYGGKKAPQNIVIEHKELVKHLEHEAFYSHIIALQVNGDRENVILKDLQRHPAKAQILHADFLRVSKDQKLTTRVPLRFINEAVAKGVKIQGGVITHNMAELEITCLPDNLPEYVEVDLIDVELGQIIHISDLKLPKGVESVALIQGGSHDLSIAAINKPKGTSGDDDSGVDEAQEKSE